MRLTEEQQAIVNHDLGPALVFAVAGAGKTSAMVARIRRLVDERRFDARHILATSFGRATVAAIKERLRDHPRYQEVTVATLHSIGYQTLLKARDLGYIAFRDMDRDETSPEQVILTRTLARARSLSVYYAQELGNFDREDFITYISVCKGNLQYADLEKAQLPPEALTLATQAATSNSIPWYLDLYRLFEDVRDEMQLVTFDDQIMRGWQMLFCHERVRSAIAGKWRCVLVDEFQDVNLAQAEMLDILTAGHRNYMAIGDEDQTIYEWRGASPRFILGFAERYNAPKYFISDNFRCCASHIALANGIIVHNKQREPKTLSLTKGFGGATYVRVGGSEQHAQYIVTEIKGKLGDGSKVLDAGGRGRGYSLNDFAVLVRMYAQTPAIEQALMTEEIPYRIVGSQPFYKRREIAVLIAYLRLMFLERRLLAGERIGATDLKQFRQDWDRVKNAPTRYISQQVSDKITEEVVYKERPLSKVLVLSSTGWQMDRFATDLDWLTGTDPQTSAASLLVQLVARLRYEDFLMQTSGFVEVGEGRVANVRAFIEFAKLHGSAAQLLAYIDEMAKRYPEKEDEDEPHVRIMTIHRAKGLQWPSVFVPGCNTGILPMGNADNIEEERRLMYVAITRTSHDLHLLVNNAVASEQIGGISSFLLEADWENRLASVKRIATGLERGFGELNDWDALQVADGMTDLHFDRYFTLWHQPEEKREEIARWREEQQSSRGRVLKKRAVEQSKAGLAAYQEGKLADSRIAHEEALGLMRQAGDKKGEVMALLNVANAIFREKKYADALRLFEECATLCRQLGADGTEVLEKATHNATVVRNAIQKR